MQKNRRLKIPISLKDRIELLPDKQDDLNRFKKEEKGSQPKKPVLLSNLKITKSVQRNVEISRSLESHSQNEELILKNKLNEAKKKGNTVEIRSLCAKLFKITGDPKYLDLLSKYDSEVLGFPF